jgi:hypothetical protein
MITSVKVPSKSGEIADIALGFDTIEGEKKLKGKNMLKEKVKEKLLGKYKVNS